MCNSTSIIKTPPKYINKRDYKGDTLDKTQDSHTKDTDVVKKMMII